MTSRRLCGRLGDSSWLLCLKAPAQLGQESATNISELTPVNPMEVILFRDMDTEADSPKVGPYNFTLGVRTDGPPLDIEVRDGYVQPEPEGRRGRGMSVAPDDPRNLNARHRPPILGGTGSYPVWWISSADLGARLCYRATGPTHGVIEPAFRMTLAEYEQAIAATRFRWIRVIGLG